MSGRAAGWQGAKSLFWEDQDALPINLRNPTQKQQFERRDTNFRTCIRGMEAYRSFLQGRWGWQMAFFKSSSAQQVGSLQKPILTLSIYFASNAHSTPTFPLDLTHLPCLVHQAPTKESTFLERWGANASTSTLVVDTLVIAGNQLTTSSLARSVPSLWGSCT